MQVEHGPRNSTYLSNLVAAAPFKLLACSRLKREIAFGSLICITNEVLWFAARPAAARAFIEDEAPIKSMKFSCATNQSSLSSLSLLLLPQLLPKQLSP